ncbi:MAG TPA: cation-transporting P-type ATPase [Nocardioidaceae bacterium]|nr:cation-transporting P-type ATPase [Nocardioidaceae bacterium]
MPEIGLTTDEAASVQESHGRNELPHPPAPSVIVRVVRQLRDPMILLLIAAAVVTIGLGHIADTSVIAAVIAVNTALGVGQELRAEKALEALGRLSAPTSKIWRDGAIVELPSSEVVPGDFVVLEAGDIVAADGDVVRAHALQVDESAVTGESMPTEFAEGDELSAGTVVTSGRATMQITRTGPDSALGRIAQLVAGAKVRPTPLQIRLARLSRTLVVVAAGASVAVFVLGLLQGTDAADMLVIAVSLAVAAVPESLPAVVAVALALGAYRMARRNAIVRSLPAVETLGSVSVLASDKTGTLTEGRMSGVAVWTPRGGLVAAEAVSGAIAENDDLWRLLEAAVLCNDARRATDGDASTFTGEALEVALLRLAEDHGVIADQRRIDWPRVAETPFDAQTRLMTTDHRSSTGSAVGRRLVKGAPEVVIDEVNDAAAAEAAASAARTMAARGLRVIAVAERSASDVRDAPTSMLLGLVGVADPPRETASEIVSACRDAGVDVVMVTGDHPDTARAIAAQVGILERRPEVALADDVEHRDRGADGTIGVFARVRPEQKVSIVEALQADGHVVAVTGDGVNDAPALRAADIGVAMGKGGTEVARQAADLVLADDNLLTVLVAMDEGRRILTNIRRFLRYALSGGLAEILVLMFAPFVGIPIPLLPGQILWINLLTHGVPGVAFGAEPGDPGAMRRGPSSPDESVLGGGLARLVVVGGTLIAVVTLAAGVIADSAGHSVQSSIFAVLSIAQLGLAIAVRAPRRRFQRHGRALEAAVAASALLQVAAIYAPPLQAFLHTAPLPASMASICLLLAALPGIVVWLTSRRGSTRTWDENDTGPESGGGERVTDAEAARRPAPAGR